MTSTIPPIREQVRRMTAGRAGKGAVEPQRETISGNDVTVLGRLRRYVFARTKDGRELRLRAIMPHAIDEAAADAILVHQQVRTSDGRTRSDTYVGNVVAPGTYKRLQRQKTYRPKERPPRPIDGLHDVRRGAARQVVSLGGGDPDVADGGSYRDIARDALLRRPGLLITDGTAPAETQSAIDALIISNAAQEAAMRAAIGSTTDQAFFDNLNRSFEESANGSGSAQLARITLGIAGVPTNPCE